jgi:hypothetical protein
VHWLMYENAFRKKMRSEANQAPQRTEWLGTDRAPSKTLRAKPLRRSALTLGK